jgi:hypothetical protein
MLSLPSYAETPAVLIPPKSEVGPLKIQCSSIAPHSASSLLCAVQCVSSSAEPFQLSLNPLRLCKRLSALTLEMPGGCTALLFDGSDPCRFTFFTYCSSTFCRRNTAGEAYSSWATGSGDAGAALGELVATTSMSSLQLRQIQGIVHVRFANDTSAKRCSKLHMFTAEWIHSLFSTVSEGCSLNSFDFAGSLAHNDSVAEVCACAYLCCCYHYLARIQSSPLR